MFEFRSAAISGPLLGVTEIKKRSFYDLPTLFLTLEGSKKFRGKNRNSVPIDFLINLVVFDFTKFEVDISKSAGGDDFP